MAQRVRGEPVGGRAALQVEQVTQPVADRAPVHPAAALVAEQRRRSREPGAHVVGEPAQDQVQPVQHRHPPRPRPRGLGALAEPDVDLAERAPPEMQVRPAPARPPPPPAGPRDTASGTTRSPARPSRTCARWRPVPARTRRTPPAAPATAAPSPTASSQATCRAALNSSSGLSSRTPNAASISPALRAVRNSWKPLNACT